MKKDKRFALLSSICCEKSSSWDEKIFLTFDIDWAHDEVINDVYQLCEARAIPATFFATHKADILETIGKKQSQFEIGLHPNFNQLLMGNNNKKNFYTECASLKNLFPNATSVRSHSLCFGSLIQTAYQQLGITHDSSVIVPCQNNTRPLFPWKMWDGLVRVPYFFCDYVTAMSAEVPVQNLAIRPGLKVFDFHPIHVFLNTESLERYEFTRPLHHKPKELMQHRYKGYGTRSRLIDLLELAGRS